MFKVASKKLLWFEIEEKPGIVFLHVKGHAQDYSHTLCVYYLTML